MNRRLLIFWLGASLVLALTLGPFLAQGNAQLERQRERHRQEISRMSASERDRLDRNYTAYVNMTPAEQQQLAQFHEAIEKDRRHGQGELAGLMDDYAHWLKTIEPNDRYQLSLTTDPAQRIAMMEQIVRKQRERTAERAFRFRGFWNADSFPSLTAESLARVMQEVEHRALDRLTLKSEDLARLESLHGLNRYVHLLHMLKASDLNQRPLAYSPPPEFESVAKDIDKFVEDSQVREFIHSGVDSAGQPDNSRGAPPFTRGQHLSGLILGALTVELLAQRRRAEKPPTQQELREQFVKLPESEQDELLRLDAADFQADLRMQYVNPESLSELPNIRAVYEMFFGPSPYMNRRPGEGPDGRRPGFGWPGRGPMEGRRPGPGDGDGQPRLRRGFRPRGDERPLGPPGGFGPGADDEDRPAAPPPRPEDKESSPARESGDQQS